MEVIAVRALSCKRLSRTQCLATGNGALSIMQYDTRLSEGSLVNVSGSLFSNLMVL